MAKLGRASLPLDLLTYRPEDEQPSVFLLREDQRQSILAVFNWTEQTRSRVFSLSELNLPSGPVYELHDALEPAAHSVKLIKIVDPSVPAAAPSVSLQAPDRAKVGEELKFVSALAPNGVPPLSYHWDFGDGTTEEGRQVTHTYTTVGSYRARLIVDGLDGVPAEKSATVEVSGSITLPPPARYHGIE